MAEGNRRGGARPSGRGGPNAKRGPGRGPGPKGSGGPPKGRRSGGSRPAKPKGKPQRDDGRRGPKEWGGVARRGAGEVRTPRPDTASDEWRKAVQRSRDGQDLTP